MKIIYLFILILISSSQFALSQSPPFKQFKSSDGLPSPDVYDCMQDSEGYMWFATADGISRFDSHEFRNFSAKDGLNSNTILNIAEKDNKLYIGTQLDGINTYSDNKISNLNFKRNSKKFDLHKIIFHKNKLYNFFHTEIRMIEGDSSISIFHIVNDYTSGKQTFIVYWLQSINNERLIAATSDGLYEVKGKIFEKLFVPGLENEVLYFVTSDKNNNIFASGDNIIYKISGDKIIDTYKFNFEKETKIYRLLVDQYGTVWFSVMNEGLFRFNPVSNHLSDLNKKLDAEKLHVNAIYQDKKNNVWVCTFGKGAYCFYNTFINNYSTKDGLSNPNVLSITGDKNQRIYCGTFNGLSVLEQDSFTIVNTLGDISVTDYIRTIKKANDSLLILSYVTEKKEFYEIMYKNVKLLYAICRSPVFINKDTLLGGSWDNFLGAYTPFINTELQKNSKFVYRIGETIPKNKINDLLKDREGKVWIASDLGVSLLQNNSVRFIVTNKLNGQFGNLKEDEHGFIWACGEKGLFILKDTSVIFEFAKKNHESISGIELDNKGSAWLATSEGLYGMSVNYYEGSVNLKEEYLLNEKAGLISNDISSLYYEKTGNLLWAGTSNGLTSVNLDRFEKQLKDSLPLRILSIGTADSVYNLSGIISFPDYTNDIRISFSSFDINSIGNLTYKYKLNKDDTVWNNSSENIISFPSLQYGDYNFQIYAQNNFGKVSEVSSANFKVETPFTRSYFFYTLIGFSAMSLTGLAVSRSLKKKYILENERNTFKNQISDLKQRSLVSMMNPHFVFNSLNSIQSFYNYKENESANEYLAKFSRLIRMNLDFADKTFIKLSDELERLESYLILEKMRFDDNLIYEIWVSDDIDPEKTEIPNMIIQPFVENAIWHGILKSQNAGKVTVNIFHSQLPDEIRKNYQIQLHSTLSNISSSIDPNPVHCIKIEITDNGIGINKCQKIKSTDHISRGISVIKERLSILHHYTGETELVKITDRSELQDPESGTIVEIYLTPNICKVNSAE